MAGTRLRLLLIYLVKRQHNTNANILHQELLLYALIPSVDIRLLVQFGYKREAAPHKA